MTTFEELLQESKAGKEEATETLVKENAGLIWSVARRFLGRGVELDDLYQLGCLGFMKALDGFDTEYGTQFSTYAVPKIAGEIRRFLRDDGAVKVSRSVKERAASIKSARIKLATALEREPTISEIAEETGFSQEEIAVAETATASVTSIYQECGDEGFSLSLILTDTESEEKLLEKIAVRQAVAKLPQREASVIALRYFRGMTQEKISRILNISQVQVSRIEKRAIQRLRQYMQ